MHEYSSQFLPLVLLSFTMFPSIVVCEFSMFQFCFYFFIFSFEFFCERTTTLIAHLRNICRCSLHIHASVCAFESMCEYIYVLCPMSVSIRPHISFVYMYISLTWYPNLCSKFSIFFLEHFVCLDDTTATFGSAYVLFSLFSHLFRHHHSPFSVCHQLFILCVCVCVWVYATVVAASLLYQ